MAPDLEENTVMFPSTVLDEPSPDLRFMHRRRVTKIDRNGDPLDGVINLFDVAIVLALGFLLAALAGFGLTDVLSSKNMTIVKNPGTADMQVIVKQGNKLQKLDLSAGRQVSGYGTLIGQFYRLQDGTTVYVPAGGTATPGTGPTPAPSSSTGASPGTGQTPAPTFSAGP